MSLNLDSILTTALDDRTKGIPGGCGPIQLCDIGNQGWNVLEQDLPLPLMVLKQSAIDNNEAVMHRFVRDNGISLAPHGKTTMCPQLYKLQLDNGAWGITVATVSQLQVCRSVGVSRVVMANQLVGRPNIRYVVDELNRDPGFDFYALADSPALVDHIADIARSLGAKRPIKLLVELGIAGGRAGCRSFGEARVVVDQIQTHSDVLTLAGVEGYEGLIVGEGEHIINEVDRYLMSLSAFLKSLPSSCFDGVDEIIISAGGTAYFDRVAAFFSGLDFKLPLRSVLRSGCYITHDSGTYREFVDKAIERGWAGRLQPAFEVWAYVQSMPESGLAILTMGKRDIPFDCGLPLPERRYRPTTGDFASIDVCTLTASNDQHAYMNVPDGVDVAVGDMISCGISHPCTAFDKWRFIPLIDDDYNVVDGLLTFF